MTAGTKPVRAMKTLFMRPDDGCFDLIGEDHDEFLCLAVVDQAKGDDGCVSCLFISYAEADRIAHWLTRRSARAERLAASEAQRKTEGAQ